jgi:glycosyltransferase involved in cell wall biosynthesis
MRLVDLISFGMMHIESRPAAFLPHTVHPLPDARHAWAPAPSVRALSASLSCVVPAFNECENLRLLLPALRDVLEHTCQHWEIIVADDGSRDGTAELMRHWVAIEGVRHVQLSRNFGKEAALSAGLDAAGGDIVICLDADMQHPPSLIPAMLARWRAGAEMVYAVRAHRTDESWAKRVGARAFYRLLNGASGVEVPANAGDFRLMDRRVVDALKGLPERTRFMKGLYAWVGFKAEPLSYVPAERAHGESRFSAWKLARLAFDGLTAFTTWPLRMVSVIGCLFALASLIYGCVLVGDYWISGNATSGWTTIVAAILFFAGVNLISVGILGEYIGRIFNEVKGRPLYVVSQRTGSGLPAGTEQKP